MWFLPTRRRIAEVRKLLQACKDTGFTYDGCLLVHADEVAELSADYAEIGVDFPNWRVFKCATEGLASKCQEAWEYYGTFVNWVGIIADDNEPETHGWAETLVSRLNGWNIVSSNDGWQSEQGRIHGATVFSGDLLRAVGAIAPAGLKHLYFDNVWETLGKTGCLQWALDVMVRHEHADLKSKAMDSTTANVRSFWKEDEKRFQQWMRSERKDWEKRIVEHMKSCGVAMIDTDVTGVRLLIATPCASGKYERVYTKSLIQTILFLKECGAEVEWYDLPYCSDPPLARAKLFTTFLNSDFTHMIQIDDDMGWSPINVVQMLKLDRDFIAAAGPRKSYPPSFAVSHTDAHGRTQPVEQDLGTGVIKVSDVGGAFVMISHRCAERMAEAYKDLEFQASDGRVYHDVYMPLVVNRRHIAEDFAFCHRWRAIGGEVHVLPQVRLAHVGSHTWEGAFSDFMVEQMAEIQEQQAALAGKVAAE